MKWLSLVFLILASTAEAKVDALFHPYDLTLKRIAKQIKTARSSIDVAMYNMDVSKENPIIATLSTPQIQERLKSKSLRIRMVFEGYSGAKGNAERMSVLEQLNVDVRFLGAGPEVHHKFMVVDAYDQRPVLVTGSANWSLSSQGNYNEAIIFAYDEVQLARAFQGEFELLWRFSREFGQSFEYEPISLDVAQWPFTHSLEAWFNSNNFIFTNQGLTARPFDQGFVLTRRLVKAIDEAQSTIEIATTRIMLRPIYEALIRAAQRGVQINAVVTMEQYAAKTRRPTEVPFCAEIYAKECSTSINYSSLLDMASRLYPNIKLRVKYFSLDPGAYLSQQMHSKYMIVDQKKVYSGSFNWSFSAEYGHIENLVFIDGYDHAKAVAKFSHDFQRLWNLNRKSYPKLKRSLRKAGLKGKPVKCSFAPMALSFSEIDDLYLSASPIQGARRLPCIKDKK